MQSTSRSTQRMRIVSPRGTRVAKLFWAKVQRGLPEECWLWTAGVQAFGYGRFSSGRKLGISTLSHRVSWVLAHGEVPEGLCVLHSCDNRLCVNPHHLFLGTNQDNSDDMVSKARQVQGEQHGNAKLSEDKVNGILYDTRTQQEIARAYQVSQSTISRVKSGESWKEITKLGSIHI